MGITEDRAYYLALAGLTVDQPSLTLRQLQAICNATPDQRLLSPLFDGNGQFVGDYDSYSASQAVSAGEEIVPRHLCQHEVALVTTQALRLTYFTARKTEVINTVRMICGGTAAGATPSLVRFGLYTVAANGDLTLVANTATDTALFNTQNAVVSKALASAYTKVAGQRYALGLLIVTAAAFPTVAAASPTAATRLGVINAVAPILTGLVTSQADLPSSVVTASVAVSTMPPLYAELVP